MIIAPYRARTGCDLDRNVGSSFEAVEDKRELIKDKDECKVVLVVLEEGTNPDSSS